MQTLYGSWSWAYSPAAWLVSGGLYDKWICAAGQFVKSGPVMDVGCGPGKLLGHLAQKNWDVIGVDQSPQMVRAAQRLLTRRRLKASVICADARHLPLDDQSVGTIINTFPMSYVHEEQTWREYLRVLQPGGRWIVVSGPRLDGFNLRLIGWYLFLIVEFGRSLGRRRKGTAIPLEFFPKQRCELVTVGRSHVQVAILEKATL